MLLQSFLKSYLPYDTLSGVINSWVKMMEVKRVSDAGGGALLRVAIRYDNTDYLKKLDVSLPMASIVRDLCEQWQIRRPAHEMALWTADELLDDGTKFMSDNNKFYVKPGAMLVLKQSPKKLCTALIDRLLDNHEDGLTAVAAESKDTEILKMLHAEKTHELVFGILEQNFKVACWIDGIKFILRLYTKRLIKKVPLKIVNKVLITVGHTSKVPEDLLVKGLDLLSAVRRYGRLRYQDELFMHLEILLMIRHQPKVQAAALQLLNYLALFPNNEDEEKKAMARVLDKKIVGIICDCILGETVTRTMQQMLYQYEILALRPYWTKKVTKVLHNDPEVEIVRRLTHRAKRGELFVPRRRIFSEGEQKLSEYRREVKKTPSLKRISVNDSTAKNRKRFSSCIDANHKSSDPAFDIEFYFPGPIFYVSLPKNPTMPKKKAASTTNLPQLFDVYEPKKEIVQKDRALSMKTYSQLTIANLRYLAKYYTSMYEQWALTKKGQKEMFAEKLTHLVCRLLEIGRSRSPDNAAGNYHALLFFTYPYFEEELFCEAFSLYEKTSREMKARVEKDVVKVLTVVSEQLACALNPRPSYFQPGNPLHFNRPSTMEQLREILAEIHYENIKEKRKQEREDRMKYNLKTKPLFLEYRSECKPAVLELIKQQRMGYVRSGHHLIKVNGKGEILTNALEYLKLTKNGDHLIIGDCFKQPEKCQHSKQIAVSDIIDVSVGKQSKFYKDVFTQNEHTSKTRPHPQHWDCFFSLKLRDNSYINFCGDSLEMMHYWTDALNLLLDKPMASATMESEMDEFLDNAVKLKFLEIEELPLPNDSPQVPPPPPNYDFCLSPKRKPVTKVIGR